MNDTPETDAKVSGHIGFYSCATVPAELCRRMERERDEARVERDSLQALSQSLAETCVKLKAERDEARAELTRHGWRLTS
jgi:hypothetical protein